VDPRTPSEYNDEANAYLSELAKQLPTILLDGAARRLTPLRLRLANQTTQNLTSLQLVVELPHGVQVAEEQTGYDRAHRPTRPIPYGEKTGYTLPTAFAAAGLLAVNPPYIPRPQVRSTEQGTEITFPGVDVRPRRAVDLDPVVLVVPEATDSPLRATWSATAKNVEAVLDGTLALPIAGEPWTLDKLLWPPSQASGQ
jgi:hypothetical protein